MDFVKIRQKIIKGRAIMYPDFVVAKNKDIMFRNGDFYAVFDQETGLWSKDIMVAKDLIERELYSKTKDMQCEVEAPSDFSNNVWFNFTKYCKLHPENYKPLDREIIFMSDQTERKDYASIKLPYDPVDVEPVAYNEIMGTIYDEANLQKLEWAIGAIYSGDSKRIQKGIALYGAPGSGKSTFLNLLEDLFVGYTETIDASGLGDAHNNFKLETMINNPLVAIQNEADLSKVTTNVALNSIMSHDLVVINAKHKNMFTMRPVSFMFVATNSPIKITDSKSGLVRRIIDVHPTGQKIPASKFKSLEKQMHKELGAIANRCIKVYEELGENAYNDYQPKTMMEITDPLFQFFCDKSDVIMDKKVITFDWLKMLYREYFEKAGYQYIPKDGDLREAFKDYFVDYIRRTTIDGDDVRHVYKGLKLEKLMSEEEAKIIRKNSSEPIIFLKEQHSLLDDLYKDCPAQYATSQGTPQKPWDEVTTTLKDIDTSKEHYVMIPEDHIVIDFDIRNEKGEKDYVRNLEESSKWPPTYTECSRSGGGIHLHYKYNSNIERLSNIYSEGIEIKRYKGKQALRRKLTKCNDMPVALFTGALPQRDDRKMISSSDLKDEKHLRAKIAKALRKEVHPNTKSNIDYIYSVLEDAYEKIKYDVSDMKEDVLIFASRSTNQAKYCTSLVTRMKFKSSDLTESKDEAGTIIFFDLEVYPNLFVVCAMSDNEEEPSIKLINPSKDDIEKLLKGKLVGFNNRRYDNHILCAALMGYNNEQLYLLSKAIVNDKRENVLFGQAYNLSYTDVYDFASAPHKQSLKKWEIQLGIHHQEMEIPWDQPVPEELIPNVVEYCCNDVRATKAVFHHLKDDWTARQILAKLSGLSVNDSTNRHTTKIIFGNAKPDEIRAELNTPDLSKEFPGYEYKLLEDGKYHNMYRGVDLGRGGYVYAEPGMYGGVGYIDVKSMHPHSILAMNLFGKFTKNFKDLVDARVFIKEKKYDKVREMFGGALAEYLEDEGSAKALSTALKTPINAVYGLTSATFETPFRDPKNVNNVVALRGALFMKTLQDKVTEMGYTVIHIKTDSMKIADSDDNVIKYCMNFAKQYGYEFDYEDDFDKICLVNDAVLIAKSRRTNEWEAVGAQFAQPYVFKTLFSKQPLEFKDYCVVKETKGKLYLDFNEKLESGEHNYMFVGRTGEFTPVKANYGGGELLVFDKDKYSSAQGAKGYRWLESSMASVGMVDELYFKALADDAIDSISKYGDFDWFRSDEPYRGILLGKRIIA